MTLVADLALVESPRWHDDRLVFSDWGARQVLSVTPDGQRDVVADVPAMPFCLDRLPDGRLVVTAGQQLLVRAADGRLAPYADLSQLSDKAWNDIVIDRHGNAYVNNVNFDFPGGEFRPGLLAVVTPNGEARLVADGLVFPNGMAISPDGSTLVVAESYASRLTAFDIQADATLSNQRTWAALEQAAPDGICFDAEGAVWFAEVPGQRCVRVAEGGEVLQQLNSELGCFACMLGGPDGRTLFVTAAAWPDAMTPGSRTGRILTATVRVPGAGWPR
nr:SMP-30/gluconolactonase/LRE family protein [Microlunatus panaciterrae]